MSDSLFHLHTEPVIFFSGMPLIWCSSVQLLFLYFFVDMMTRYSRNVDQHIHNTKAKKTTFTFTFTSSVCVSVAAPDLDMSPQSGLDVCIGIDQQLHSGSIF
jgi:hypothetical protein